MKRIPDCRVIVKALALVLALCVVSGLARAADNPAVADYQAFLARHRAGVMTTVDGQQPRTRVFQYLFSDGDKSYFCTGTMKDVYKQLQANNRVSFCVYAPEANIVLSLDGPAVFVDDAALKQKVLDDNPSIKGIYGSGDNPEFALFYVVPEAIYSFSFTGGKEYIKQ